MRSLDRGVEIQFALRDMTNRALVVADLRPAGMIGAGGEIDIVVAGAASHPSRPREVSRRLRGAGVLLVAHFAAARVGRMHDGREVGHASLKADDLIRVACLDAGQFGAHVDLMDHHRQVDRVAGIGIGGLRRVAQDAHLDAAPRPAVRGELIVTPVAALRPDHIVSHRDRASRWARS